MSEDKNLKIKPCNYDTVMYYEKIMKQLMRGVINNKWLCTDNEKSYTNTLIDIINKCKREIWFFRRETLIIQRVLLYELEKVQDEKDETVLNYLYISISKIRTSYKEMFAVFETIEYKLNNTEISENSDIAKAIIHDCATNTRRITEKRKMIRDEYIYLSMIRPYYFNLQKKGISFKEDIENHINIYGKWEDELDSFSQYVDGIIAFAEKSGKTNYIDARLENYDRVNINRINRELEKKQKNADKVLERQINKLNTYVHNKETTIRRNPNSQQSLIDIIMKQSGYHTYCSCSVIVAIQKIDQEKIVFFTGTGFSTNIKNSKFYFDNEQQNMQKEKEVCSAYEGIKCVTTLQIF